MGNSLSQKDRKNRIGKAKKITAIDNSMESLLLQAEKIAAFLRYYNFSNTAAGYFDEMLHDLHQIRTNGIKHFIPDGKLEPSQALLYVFLHQLHTIGQHFNQRVKDYANWYLHHYLNLKPLPLGKHKVCVFFQKNTDDPLVIEKDFGFLLKENKNQTLVYRLSEDTFIGNVSIERLFSLHFCKQANIYPASHLDYVTALIITNLKKKTSHENMMFVVDENSKHVRKLGFLVTSPSLLLREGKRHVKFKLKFEKSFDIQSVLDILKEKITDEEFSHEGLEYLFFHDIFFISISTSNGWKNIEDYIIAYENECLRIEFSLAADFPATTACEEELHKFNSKYPSIRFILNVDAWLYAYSWLKDIFLEKIFIETDVSDISNILVYNDLGRIDNSKPFNPFGINTEKGAWFTVGNYEMALKNTHTVHLKIEWGQLPTEHDGLYGYYKGYNTPIDNTSFKINSRYLIDYRWKNDKKICLFASEPQQENDTPYPNAPLANTGCLKDISVENMPPIKMEEEQYEYNIYTQSGFISLVLVEPETGFGEKVYRNIFTDYIIKNSLKKKSKTPTPNPPVNPQIERLTMSYSACDEIDMRKKDIDCCDSAFYHISSFGNHLMYPSREVDKVPLIYSMDTNANILILFSGLEKGRQLNLYFDFHAVNKEITLDYVPQIKWYLGNGYLWEQIPDRYIVKDKTRNLLASGIVKINIPENISHSLFNNKQQIWLRIGIEQHECAITCLKDIYVNVGEAELRMDEHILENEEPVHFVGDLELERKIPGIENFYPVSFYGGRKKEVPEEMLMRFSEFVSHRGKAVTPKDIERITLQEFPDIGKVKCFPDCNCKTEEKAVATLVVIPQINHEDKAQQHKPMANSRQILKIEYLLKKRVSAYLKKIDVINPLYEELIVRCKIKFNRKISTAACKAGLQDLFNEMIAPWQKTRELPFFDYYLDTHKLYEAIGSQNFTDEILHLSIVRITQNDEYFQVFQYGKDCPIIKPSKAFAIFIPAKEHIILDSETDTSIDFGIDEMIINESFIINEEC